MSLTPLGNSPNMATMQDNVGSAARDQLANERTFLAWVRTGLGLIGVGLLLAKLVDAGNTTLIGGLAFITWGAGIMIYALARFRRVSMLLTKGQYEAARWGPVVLTVAGLVAAWVALVIVAITM